TLCIPLGGTRLRWGQLRRCVVKRLVCAVLAVSSTSGCIVFEGISDPDVSDGSIGGPDSTVSDGDATHADSTDADSSFDVHDADTTTIDSAEVGSDGHADADATSETDALGTDTTDADTLLSPVLSIAPKSQDFGSLSIGGTSSPTTFTVSNAI